MSLVWSIVQCAGTYIVLFFLIMTAILIIVNKL
jgi:hypothetical protein